MPVSHLGFPVSDITSATSFYLSALQPLGYRYIGQRGDSVGLGIHDADFFLCQTKNGARPSPTHIAFSANARLIVRECYTAALNAGGRPSGAPGYRNDDCSCFNAAVEDFDGNTVEFIFREPCEPAPERSTAPTDTTVTRAAPKDSTRNGFKDFASYASKAHSTAQTALDLASSASKTYKEHKTPAPGIRRSSTEPIGSSNQNSGKTLAGTLLGAAAGVAVAYALGRSERENARDEAAFTSSMRSRDSHTRDSQAKSTATKRSSKSHHASNTHESSRQPLRTRPAIEAAPYDDYEVQDVISRYKSSTRPGLERSRTYDGIEYVPRTNTSAQNDRFSMKRASTMPLDTNNRYIEAPPSKSASRHSGRRGSLDASNLKRHDSGVSLNSRRSRRSSYSKSSANHRPRRNSWHDSAAKVPLPSSKATSHTTRGEKTPRASKAASYVSAAKVPLPYSRTTSYASQDHPPPSFPNSRDDYANADEESDGLGDLATVVPDDSISCVDFSEKKKTRSGTSQTSKRSENDSDRTIRPPKSGGSRRSARTLPLRRKDERYGRRSNATYA